ncbi:MAG: PAS domain S-box protein [Deltaproteobacteria bacterium]|nr:PAS domain S-box protein [Candidatus Zymogenaceae bacterium]
MDDKTKTPQITQDVVRALIEESGDGIAVIQDQKIVFSNRNVQERLGYTKDELESMFIHEIIHPEDIERVANYYIRLRENRGPVYTVDFRAICKDGSLIFTEANTSIIKWDGDIAGLCIFRDVAKRKHLEETLLSEMQRRSDILDSLSERLIYTDTNMCISWANKAAADSVSLSQSDLVGNYCYEIFRAKSRVCDECPGIETLRTGRYAEADISYPDKTIWVVRTYPNIKKENKLVGLTIKSMDVTKIREWETENGKRKKTPRTGTGKGKEKPFLNAPADPQYMYPFSLRFEVKRDKIALILRWDENDVEHDLALISRSEMNTVRLLYLAARMKTDGSGWVEKGDIKAGRMDYNLYELRKAIVRCQIPWLDDLSARMMIRSSGVGNKAIRLAIAPERIDISGEVRSFRSKKYDQVDKLTLMISEIREEISKNGKNEYLDRELEIQERNLENTRKSIQTIEFLIEEAFILLGGAKKI